MLYAPSGQFLWDFWLIRHAELYHLYHLQAPRSLTNPELRHGVATVRHATSPDLVVWTDRGTILEPGPDGSWDDMCIWTGSVIERDGRFYMLYTARNKSEHGAVQRIGLVVSDNLDEWERVKDKPIIQADSRWYEKVGNNPEGRESWRDPYVLYNAADNAYYAFISARVNHGPPDGRGCIAAARSKNLLDWEVLPPVAAPRNFYDMEVPNVWRHNNRYYLAFAMRPRWYTARYAEKIAPLKPQNGVLYYTSECLLGPYAPAENEVLLGTDSGCYTCRIMDGPHGGQVLMTWRERAAGSEEFVGRLEIPRPLVYGADGSLAVGSGLKEA